MSELEASYAEKRRSPRLPVAFVCRVEDAACEIQDISYAGLRFRSVRPFEPNTEARLILPSEDDQPDAPLLYTDLFTEGLAGRSTKPDKYSFSHFILLR